MTSIEIVVPGGASLGENPLWSAHDQLLYWLDIEGRRIHRYNPSSGDDADTEIATRPGSIALTDEPGRLLVATENEVGWFEFGRPHVSSWQTLEPGGTGNRLNDGRTDRSGRFWVGSMYQDTAARRSTGLLHRLDGDGRTTTFRTEIGVSNGIAFSPDGRTMYFADSPRRTVWSYDYDPDSGDPHNERVFVDLADLDGFPDGACVDAEGCYWMAGVYGWRLYRFTPGGRLDRTIELPVARPTMPAFGGPDLDVLYVTSIRAGGPVDERDAEAGGVLALDVGVSGIAETPFAAQWGTGV